MANFFKLLFLENDLVGHEYVEPYAGGASVALALLVEEYASRIHINDLNRSVHAFWLAVLEHTDDLCKRISDVGVTVDEWRRQRAIQADKDADVVDLAFSTFFLNRVNRSGIIEAGLIGGKEQEGDWKMDARYNKPALINRIRKIARYRNRITLTRLDAGEYLQFVLPTLPEQTLVYLDPPYYVKGSRLYEHWYRHQDHEVIARLVDAIRQRWVVSYDAAAQILELYADRDPLIYGLSYSAQDKYTGAEVMYLSPDLTAPSVRSPAKVTGTKVDRERLARL